jgi:hypothetical protein
MEAHKARLEAERADRALKAKQVRLSKERARVEYVSTSAPSHSSAHMIASRVVKIVNSENAHIGRIKLVEWLEYQFSHDHLPRRASGTCTVIDGKVFPHAMRAHVESNGPPAQVPLTVAQEAWKFAEDVDMVLCEVNGAERGDHRLLLLYRDPIDATGEHDTFQSLFVVARGNDTPRLLKVPVRVGGVGYVITVDAGSGESGTPPVGWVFAFLYFCVMFREFVRSNSIRRSAMSRTGWELVQFLGACAGCFTGDICRDTLDLVSNGKYAAFNGSRVIERPVIPTDIKFMELVYEREREVGERLRTIRNISAHVIRSAKVYKTFSNGHTNDTLLQMAAITPPTEMDNSAPWNHVHARGRTYLGVNVIQWLRRTFPNDMPLPSDGNRALQEGDIAAWDDANSTIRAVTVDLTSVYGGYTHPFNGSPLIARDLGREPIHDKRSLRAFRPMVLVMAHFPVWLLEDAATTDATFHVLMFIVYNDDDVTIHYTTPFDPTCASDTSPIKPTCASDTAPIKPTSAGDTTPIEPTNESGKLTLPKLIDVLCAWMLKPIHRIGTDGLIRLVVDDMFARAVASSDKGLKIRLGDDECADALLVEPDKIQVDAREIRESIKEVFLSVSNKCRDIRTSITISCLCNAFAKDKGRLHKYWRMDPWLLLSSLSLTATVKEYVPGETAFKKYELGVKAFKEYIELGDVAGRTYVRLMRGLVDRSLTRAEAYSIGSEAGESAKVDEGSWQGDDGAQGTDTARTGVGTVGPIRVRSYRVTDRASTSVHDVSKLRDFANILWKRVEHGNIGRLTQEYGLPDSEYAYHHPVTSMRLTIEVVKTDTAGAGHGDGKVSTIKYKGLPYPMSDAPDQTISSFREKMNRMIEDAKGGVERGVVDLRTVTDLETWLKNFETRYRSRGSDAFTIPGLKPLRTFTLTQPSFESDTATKNAFRIAMLKLIEDAGEVEPGDASALKQRLALFELNELARKHYQIDKRLVEIKKTLAEQNDQTTRVGNGIGGNIPQATPRDEAMELAMKAASVKNLEKEKKQLEGQLESIRRNANAYVIVRADNQDAADVDMGDDDNEARLFDVDEVPRDEGMRDIPVPSDIGTHSDIGDFPAPSDTLAEDVHVEQGPTHGLGSAASAGSSDGVLTHAQEPPSNPKRRRLRTKTRIVVGDAKDPVDVGDISVSSQRVLSEGDTPISVEIPAEVDSPPDADGNDSSGGFLDPVKITTIKHLRRERYPRTSTPTRMGGDSRDVMVDSRTISDEQGNSHDVMVDSRTVSDEREGPHDILVDPRTVSDELVRNIYNKVSKKFEKVTKDSAVDDYKNKNNIARLASMEGTYQRPKRKIHDNSMFAT